ncbi:hypothetical protein L596_020450 [Steinernema carpocapsae]|uniref:Uncharacterized protein n=1 Tax=Steinernema carpocapsae TaxID=34508 RepID=A0A4U5MTK3_STECR|nr:hypothetical protein L596_020450 [Steinernema carpocapsae]
MTSQDTKPEHRILCLWRERTIRVGKGRTTAQRVAIKQLKKKRTCEVVARWRRWRLRHLRGGRTCQHCRRAREEFRQRFVIIVDVLG